MFEGLLSKIQKDVSRTIFRIDLGQAVRLRKKRPNRVRNNGASSMASTKLGKDKVKSVQNSVGQKIGRNDPCHCGSGKKYKKCHGA